MPEPKTPDAAALHRLSLRFVDAELEAAYVDARRAVRVAGIGIVQPFILATIGAFGGMGNGSSA